MENTARQVRVAGGDRGNNRGRCLSQMKDLGEGKLSAWSALPEGAHRRQKMARKVAAIVMNSDKNSVVSSDCGGADGDDGYGLIASCKVVMTIWIRLLEKGRGLARSEPKWRQCDG